MAQIQVFSLSLVIFPHFSFKKKSQVEDIFRYCFLFLSSVTKVSDNVYYERPSLCLVHRWCYFRVFIQAPVLGTAIVSGMKTSYPIVSPNSCPIRMKDHQRIHILIFCCGCYSNKMSLCSPLQRCIFTQLFSFASSPLFKQNEWLGCSCLGPMYQETFLQLFIS